MDHKGPPGVVPQRSMPRSRLSVANNTQVQSSIEQISRAWTNEPQLTSTDTTSKTKQALCRNHEEGHGAVHFQIHRRPPWDRSGDTVETAVPPTATIYI